MEERQEQQVEITFRLSAGLLGELAGLLAAAAVGEAGERRRAAAPSPVSERLSGEESRETVSQSFDMARFQVLSAQAAEAGLPLRRDISAVEAAFPSGKAAEYNALEAMPARQPAATAETGLLARERRGEARVETGEMRVGGPAFPVSPLPAGETAEAPAADAEALSRRFERDSRRYDGGFPLY